MPGTLVVENGVPSVHRRAVTTRMHTTLWPLFDLVVRTPRLELRYPDDELLVQLAELSSQPIHDPDVMPFSEPWTDAAPEDLPRGSLKHFWSRRAAWEPHDSSDVLAQSSC